MTIKPINSLGKAYESSNKDSKVKKEESQRIKSVKNDKLELSTDALKLASVKQRIKEGFYENESVLDEVAKKLLYDIEK